MNALEWMEKSRLVPVIRASSSDEAVSAIDALGEAGVDVFEITMTVPGAVEVIRRVAAEFAGKALVGAGTVLDADTARRCIDAGAQFVVSPCTVIEVIEACRQREIPIAPGALTPTEVVHAWNAGASVVKIFPCEAMGGVSYVKALKAPLPHIPIMPTGGVTLDNVGEFIKAGAMAVGVGGNLVDLKLLREGKRAEFVSRAAAFRASAVG